MPQTRRATFASAGLTKILPILVGVWALFLVVDITLMVDRPAGWRSSLFFWGAALGLLGVGHVRLSAWALPKLVTMSPAAVIENRRRNAPWRLVHTCTYVVLGVTLGAFSGASGIVWWDLAMTPLLVSHWVSGYRRMARAGRTARSTAPDRLPRRPSGH